MKKEFFFFLGGREGGREGRINSKGILMSFFSPEGTAAIGEGVGVVIRT